MTNRLESKNLYASCYRYTSGTWGYTASVQRGLDYESLSSGNSPRVNGVLKLKENSLSQYTRHWRCAPLKVSYMYDSRFAWDYAAVGGLSWGDPPLDAGVRDEAVTKLYAKLTDTHMDLGESFAEMHQTLSFVEGGIRTITGWYKDLKHGRIPWTAQTFSTGNAADLWLQYRYAWTPLVNDIYGVCTLDNLSPRPLELVARSSKVENWVKDTNFNLTYWTANRHEEARVTHKATAYAKIDVLNTYLQFQSHLGLTNPVELAWNLLPYSFVVDWFLPIGDWLAAQNALVGLSVKEASTTRTSFYYEKISAYPTTPRSSKVSGALGYVEGYGFRLRKTRTLGLSPPPLPHIQNPLNGSITRVLDALSLLTQTFKG